MSTNIDMEKEVIKYKYQLQRQITLLDKALLFVLLLIIGFFGNAYLSAYKSSLTKEHFLLESRLDALKELASVHSKLSQEVISLINIDLNKEDDSKLYKDLIKEFDRKATASKSLFSHRFDIDSNLYLWFHYAIAYGRVKINKDDYVFIADVLSGFDQSITSALLKETLGEKTKSTPITFSFPKWDHHELYNSESKDAFNAIKKEWESFKKADGR
uniref:Uncharacterized protein n=2 Tax=unclassified Candidatus Kentrum TaxID=2643149 RepID=A0A451A3Q1_9GAMM|nr:MAG: hypothetical protein BECKLPF1236B_GA0070989_10648 [Candidatus Kentron sp. LPFa]VFK60660.1 MAG: hypothetical protein BECKUNK1418G_GA0071005_101233 [Candidatus Kentron sp. UNK]VFK69844.1 MAG: hypothetical protein BECKUNK1418H_GA0071006_10209 [Candidatus Kentron sp. UNK]